jgi:hypothetical protein
MKTAALALTYQGLIGHLLLATGVAVGAGTYPTWAVGGCGGLRAELTAAAILGLLNLASGAVLVRWARLGPAVVTMAFMSLGLLRVLVCAALGAAAWQLLRLRADILLVWLCALYLAMLAGEGLWLVRALRRDAYEAALRRIVRGGRGWTVRL